MRRLIVLLISLMVLASLLAPAGRSSSVLASMGAAPALAKKTCHTVTKKVHGKKKKVKVCKTVKPKPKPTPTATPIPHDLLAHQLADALSAASTPDARYAALLDVMRALHLGVYNLQSGDPIVTGSESGPHDVYLYDAELRVLAHGLEKGELHPLAGLAALLSALGIKPNGQPVNPEALRGLLLLKTKEAISHPADDVSLLPLLVRELGLHHSPSYDLGGDVPTSQIQLDALQYSLLAIDLLAPIVHSAPASSLLLAHRPAGSPCKVINYLLNGTNPNTYLPDALHLNYTIDATISAVVGELIGAMGTVGKMAGSVLGKVGNAATLLSVLHALLLSHAITVQSGPPLALTTHYGPPGPYHEADAGQKLEFKAHVQFDEGLVPADVAECITDAGFTIPHGPIPNMGIRWHPTDNDLWKWGTVTFQPPGDGSSTLLSAWDDKTDAAGNASLIFTPRDEPVPGFGPVITQTGGVEPRALWGMAFESMPGTVMQLFTPKLGSEIRYVITYHKPRGFTFNLHMAWDGVPGPGSTGPGVGSGDCSNNPDHKCHGSYTHEHEDWSYRLSVCGADPYNHGGALLTQGTVWKGKVYRVTTYTFSDGYTETFPTDSDVQWKLDPSTQKFTGSYLYPPTAGSGEESDATFIPQGPNTSVQIHARRGSSGYWGYTPTEQTQTATVTEDTSCPDNSQEP